MADDQGRVIHELPNPTQPNRPDTDRDPPRAPCIGCRGFHGGVGQEIHCLRAALIAERNARVGDRLASDKETARLVGMLEELRNR